MNILDGLNTPAARYIPFGVCLSFVVYISLLPVTLVEADIPKRVQAYDIPFHFLIYFFLTFTAIRALARVDTLIRDRINLFLLCSVLGAVLEILQATLPGINRGCTVSDALSNMTGAFLAAVIIPSKILIARNRPFPT